MSRWPNSSQYAGCFSFENHERSTRLRLASFIFLAVSLLTTSSCNRAQSKTEPPPPPLTIHLVHSPEVRPYATYLQDKYFHQKHIVGKGQQIVIETLSEQSVGAARRIASGELKTEAWLAPSTSLVSFVNTHIKNLGARQILCTGLFSTPVVIATRAQDQAAFEADKNRFHWRSVFQGFGKTVLKSNNEHTAVNLMHASPTSSVSGLAAIIQLSSMSAIGQNASDPMTGDNLVKRLRQVELSVSAYSATESSLFNRVVNSQTSAPLAVLTTEQQLATFNADTAGRFAPLVALYPDEGSYWEDYQLCVSDADWVTPELRGGIDALVKLALSPEAQLEIKKRGFRPITPQIPDTAPLLESHGLNLALPERSFKAIDGNSVQFLLDNWSQISRPMAITVILDTSGSMEGTALNGAKNAIREILASLDSRSRTSLISFSAQANVLSDFISDPASLIPRLDVLEAQGGSALYDALRKALEININPEMAGYRKIMVLITDGDDKNSEISRESLLGYIVKNVAKNEIDLSVIAVSQNSVDYSDLEQFSKAANGSFRKVNANEIESVIHEIAEKF